MDPTLGQRNSIHTLTPYFFTIHFNTILISTSRSPKWSLPFRISN